MNNCCLTLGLGGPSPPPNSKIAITRKKNFTLTYPEKPWIFLKCIKETIRKGFGSKISCLTAWKSRVVKKKCKNVQIWPNNMTFHTDKDLDQIIKVYTYIGQECRFKKAYFCCTLIQAVEVKDSRAFYMYVPIID